MRSQWQPPKPQSLESSEPPLLQDGKKLRT